MDIVTIDLLSAIEFLLKCDTWKVQGNPQRWTFEEGSEVHLALTEAATQARIALGIDRAQVLENEPTAG